MGHKFLIMSIKIFLTIIFLGFFTFCNGQVASMWDRWSWLLGEWQGEGSGQPGQGRGSFTFKTDLDQKVLVRKSHSEYPAKENKPKIIHDDLMIIYPDFSGNPVKAIYFDNEGHTINYSITYTEKTIALTSEMIPNVPVFRLIYSLLEDLSVNTVFEISRDGKIFSKYIEGRSRRTAGSVN